MNRFVSASFVLSTAYAVTACSAAPSEGNSTTSTDELSSTSASAELVSWNQIALDTVWKDATPPGPGEKRVTGQQGGPTRGSRALAIVHIAIYDAVQSIAGTYQPYTVMPSDSHANMGAAIAVAAHDTLAALYPSQKPDLDLALQHDLSANTTATKKAGIARGALAASNILALRADDGSQVPEPTYADMHLPTGPGQWAPDVLSQAPIALGGYWMNVEPFALDATNQFRAPAPLALDSDAYKAQVEDTRNFGGDGMTTPTQRTDEQTQIGIYWGYDGAPKIGTPPRLYNMITMQIAKDQGLFNQPAELSRVLAAVNTAMADAAMAAWDSKYFYNLWRPTNAIRASAADGSSDATWTALGAMESNTTSPDFTPPFPAYPSGHATFGGALFQVLRRVLGDSQFTFVSDEFNGTTTGHDGNPRPRLPRTFSGFTQAEAENARSRIYLGVHWQEDADSGIAMGNKVGDFVVDNYFGRRGAGAASKPVPGSGSVASN
jgi:PAP2 superfamily